MSSLAKHFVEINLRQTTRNKTKYRDIKYITRDLLIPVSIAKNVINPSYIGKKIRSESLKHPLPNIVEQKGLQLKKKSLGRSRACTHFA